MYLGGVALAGGAGLDKWWAGPVDVHGEVEVDGAEGAGR
jgi:hypothetical protein